MGSFQKKSFILIPNVTVEVLVEPPIKYALLPEKCTLHLDINSHPVYSCMLNSREGNFGHVAGVVLRLSDWPLSWRLPCVFVVPVPFGGTAVEGADHSGPPAFHAAQLPGKRRLTSLRVQ